MASDEDKILFIKVKQGNKAAFNALFNKFYIRLCRFAISFTKSPELAEEAVQNTFVKLWCQRASVEITTSPISYLFTAVKNNSLNELKKNKIRIGREADYAENTLSEKTNDIGINENGFKDALKIAVRQLPGKCREIFMLSKNEGLTYDEIAAYLHISAKTVENQMGIAFMKLRDLLKPFLVQILE